jgi:peptidylprolyl isomerase
LKRVHVLALLLAVVVAIVMVGVTGVDALASTNASIDAVRVSGTAPAKPKVSFEKPFVVTANTKRVVDAGTGPIAAAGQRATIRFVMVDGRTGKQIRTSYGWNPANLLLDPTSTDRTLVDTLTGAAVGTRLLMAAPSRDPFVKGLSGSGALQRGDTVLLVVDLLDLHDPLAVATGTAETPPPLPGLPTVVDDGTGAPAVTLVSGQPPSDLQAAVLIRGTGPRLETGENVLVDYEGFVWRTGKLFDSTWRGGHPVTIPIGIGQVISGWDNGLIGQTVGSRVVLVVPPDQAYGVEGRSAAGIEPGDTLVFVIDVLDAWR